MCAGRAGRAGPAGVGRRSLVLRRGAALAGPAAWGGARWSCGLGRRSLVLRAFRPAAGSVANLCRGVEPAAGRCRSVDPCLFTPRHARLSTPLLIERWQMAGMGSSWCRHTVRLPSLDGVPVPDSCWPPTSPPPLGTGPGTRDRPHASAPRDGKWLVLGRDGGGIPCVCHLSAREPGGARVRDPVGPG